MTTTAPAAPIRKCDIIRALNRALGKTERSAAHGWDVIDDGSGPYITLNFFTPEDDRAALDKITAAMGARYRLRYTPVLAEYDHLPEEYNHCAAVDLWRRTPAQEDPMPTTPAPADTVTLRIPGRVTDFFAAGVPDLAASLDPMDRDIAAALDHATTARHGKNGTVTVMTTAPVIAAGFLARLAANADAEFDADDADTRGATAALAYVARCEAQGISTTVPDGYRMQDPAAQAALDAERARRDREQQETADRETARYARRASWQTLTREEQQQRTTATLDAAAAVLGFQRTDTRNWLNLGSVAASVDFGPLYMEVHRPWDPTARPALDAARETLAAAGWTITDHGDSFYADAPQEGPTAAQEGPAAAPVTVEWTHMVKGHQNGTATVNGTAYKITHLTRARADRGALGDHLAYAVTGGRTLVARTWGLDDLLTAVARHAGVTGPLAVTQTHSRR